jgi:hypothetical protein
MKFVKIFVLVLILFSACKKEKIKDIYYQVGVVTTVEKKGKKYKVYYIPNKFYRGAKTDEYNDKTVISYPAENAEKNYNVGDSVKMVSDPNVFGKSKSYSQISGKWPN